MSTDTLSRRTAIKGGTAVLFGGAVGMGIVSEAHADDGDAVVKLRFFKKGEGGRTLLHEVTLPAAAVEALRTDGDKLRLVVHGPPEGKAKKRKKLADRPFPGGGKVKAKLAKAKRAKKVQP